MKKVEPLTWHSNPTKPGWYWILAPNDSESHGPHYMWLDQGDWVYGYRDEIFGGMQRCAGPLTPPPIPDRYHQ